MRRPIRIIARALGMRQKPLVAEPKRIQPADKNAPWWRLLAVQTGEKILPLGAKSHNTVEQRRGEVRVFVMNLRQKDRKITPKQIDDCVRAKFGGRTLSELDPKKQPKRGD